jgi:hypothetical protein
MLDIDNQVLALALMAALEVITGILAGIASVASAIATAGLRARAPALETFEAALGQAKIFATIGIAMGRDFLHIGIGLALRLAAPRGTAVVGGAGGLRDPQQAKHRDGGG